MRLVLWINSIMFDYVIQGRSLFGIKEILALRFEDYQEKYRYYVIVEKVVGLLLPQSSL